MTEQEARLALAAGDGNIHEDGSLTNSGRYVDWDAGDSGVVLDGMFKLPLLKAIVWWMEHNPQGPKAGETYEGRE